MKLLFENWRKYLNEGEISPAQRLRNSISDWQGKERTVVKTGKEIAAELGYEVEDPDSDADDADELRNLDAKGQEYTDSQKLLDVFWDSGAQAVQLAEMTDNTEMAEYFNEIINMVKDYISRLDGYISGKLPFDRKPHLTGNSVENDANKIATRARQIKVLYAPKSESTQFERWVDMLIESGDYIWYHGTPSPSSNYASEETARSEYESLKTWAGV